MTLAPSCPFGYLLSAIATSATCRAPHVHSSTYLTDCCKGTSSTVQVGYVLPIPFWYQFSCLSLIPDRIFQILAQKRLFYGLWGQVIVRMMSKQIGSKTFKFQPCDGKSFQISGYFEAVPVWSRCSKTFNPNRHKYCGQYYKASTIVTYASRVVNVSNLLVTKSL